MAAGSRPLTTIKALAKHFGERWGNVTQLEISETGIKIGFSDGVVPIAAPAATVVTADKPLQEPALNDADLALSPPAGMLAPPPPEEQN